MLKQKLMEDLKQAMKQGEKVKCSVVRSIMAGVKNAEIEKQKELDDAEVITVISKQVKQHKESIEAYQKGGREDLVAEETAELEVLNAYMPKQMSAEDIAEAAKKVIAEVGAKGPQDKGKVMGKLMGQLKGKADGNEINKVVTELLNT